jgi:hypothetical protein
VRFSENSFKIPDLSLPPWYTSRLFWYSGVTVLLYCRLGYLEVVWIVCANLPLVRLASVASAVNPHWGEKGSKPLFNLNHKHKNDLMLAFFIFLHRQEFIFLFLNKHKYFYSLAFFVKQIC